MLTLNECLELDRLEAELNNAVTADKIKLILYRINILYQTKYN